MAIITISREFGSFGTSISQKTANELAYSCVDKEMIEKVLQQYGFVYFKEVYDYPHSIWDQITNQRNQKDVYQYIKLFSDTMLAFAKQNNIVLVGRSGFVLLNAYKDVLNVLIRAPFEVRVERTMRNMNITDEKEAAKMVRNQDSVRNSFIHTFYHAKPSDVEWFNIVVDTDKVEEDTAVRWIVEAAKHLDKQKIAPEKSAQSADIDPILQRTVIEVLQNV